MKCMAGRNAVRPATGRPTGTAAQALRVDRAAVALHGAIAAALALAASVASRAAHAADLNSVNNAAKIASGVGAGTAVPSLGVGAVLQTLLALAIVIGIVFGCAWIARRFGLQPMQRGGVVKTIGSASLGGKERVAVVQIGDTWLVLGAAPGNVRVLHTMPADSAATDAAGAAGANNTQAGAAPLHGSFGQRFRDALKSEAGKRLGRRQDGDS
jgi:flagellar protein FliO/FliZ